MTKFRDTQHRQQYVTLLARMRNRDPYHKSAAYIMALAGMVPEDVFNFEGDGIKHDGIFAGRPAPPG